MVQNSLMGIKIEGNMSNTNTVIENEFKNKKNRSMIAKIEPFFKKTDLIDLCSERKKQLERKADISFNLFRLISPDKYHHENLHSDIIQALLDPKSDHKENDKFLIEFLRLLNQIKPLIQLTDFKNSIVERESGGSDGRIDLLIKDETSKKAIIIENKINNARNTPQQLPRYLKEVSKEYEVVAIVYLPLNPKKDPKSDWTPDQIQEIDPKLIILPAWNGTKKDLNGWLSTCRNIAKNNDAHFVIKQYMELINNLSIKNMDNTMMDSFYSIVFENYETVMETNKLLTQLLPKIPAYLAKKVVESNKIDPKPFTKRWIWKDKDTKDTITAVIDEYKIGDYCFTIDIRCTLEGYSFEFFCRDGDPAEKMLQKIVQEIDLEKELTFSENRFKKPFTIPQENELLKFIDDFCKRLVNRINAVS